MSRKVSSFLVGIIAGAAATLMLPRIMKKLTEAAADLPSAQQKSARRKPRRKPVKRKLIAIGDASKTKATQKKTQT